MEAVEKRARNVTSGEDFTCKKLCSRPVIRPLKQGTTGQALLEADITVGTPVPANSTPTNICEEIPVLCINACSEPKLLDEEMCQDLEVLEEDICWRLYGTIRSEAESDVHLCLSDDWYDSDDESSSDSQEVDSGNGLRL